jgi:Predicted periplasmic ligand-binding sensor domain
MVPIWFALTKKYRSVNAGSFLEGSRLVKRIIKKTAVLTGVLALLALTIANAVSTSRNLRHIGENGRLRKQAAQLQADISGVLISLLDLEAGQRGYLLTGNPSYLETYNSSTKELPAQFLRLRSELASGPAHERELESQLESLTQSKLADADETIRLRQKGYRHRAFGIVDTNRGKELMDQARGCAAALSAAATARSSDYEQRTKASLDATLTMAVGSALVLMFLTAVVFGLLWAYSRGLEGDVVRGSHALREKTTQLESLTLTVSQKLPDLLTGVQDSLNNFLNHFLDYLPAGGQKHAAQIKQMAEESNRLIKDSLVEGCPSPAHALDREPLLLLQQ